MLPPPMDLSIVLVHYKTPQPLARCLESLAPVARTLSTETIVVDNDSGDAAPAGLPPGVRLIANAENVGYARAVNQGTRATTGEFVLVMNPDCEVQPGAIEALIRWLREHPRCAVAGPRLLNPDGSLEFS